MTRVRIGHIIKQHNKSTNQRVANLILPLNLDLVQAREATFVNGVFAIENIDTARVNLNNANLIIKNRFKAEEVHIRSCSTDVAQCTLEFDTLRSADIQFESNPRVYGGGIVRFRQGLFLYAKKLSVSKCQN